MVSSSILSDTFHQVINAGKSSSSGVTTVASGGHWTFAIVGIVIAIALFATIGAFIWFFYFEKKKWTILTRIHYENPAINGVSFGRAIKTKRVRFKDGKVVYIYQKPIQGYTISPELLTWTRPGEHDIIVTQDKKVFVINGIKNIDIARKQLDVDISYPDIEMDRQDLQQFVNNKKYDDPNERFKIIAKASMWVFVIVAIIVLVVIGGKSYVQGKHADLQRDQVNLQTAQLQAQVTTNLNTFILILSHVMPQSFQNIDGKVLLNQTLNGTIT